MTEKATKTIDARGLSCPQPVILAKQALGEGTGGSGEGFQVLVNSPTARDNVKKFALSKGFNVDVEENNDEFVINISKA